MLINLCILVCQAQTTPVWATTGTAPNGFPVALIFRGTTLTNSVLVSNLGPWVSKWQGLAAIDRSGRLAALSPSGKLEVKSGPVWDSGTDAFAVSPDGTRLASFDLDKNTLSIREVVSGRLLFRYDPAWLRKRSVHASRDLRPIIPGLAWSPSGREVAFAVAEESSESGDGTGPDILVTVDLGAQTVRTRGNYAPSAYLSETTILGQTNTSSQVGQSLVKVEAGGKVTRGGDGFAASDFDGQDVLTLKIRSNDDLLSFAILNKDLQKVFVPERSIRNFGTPDDLFAFRSPRVSP